MANNEKMSFDYLNDSVKNNTFGIRETEKSIRYAVENSFGYLRDIEKSYVNIPRFNLLSSDIYIDNDFKAHIQLKKDLIESPNRERYKLSSLFNKYCDIETIVNNDDIFSYVPVVLVDGQFAFNISTKYRLDGVTDIRFENFKPSKMFMEEQHSISVTLFKNIKYYKFLISYNSISSNKWVIPHSFINKSKFTSDDAVLAFIMPVGNEFGSNINVGKIDKETGDLSFENNISIFCDKNRNKSFTIVLMSPVDMFRIDSRKQIRLRTADSNKSAVAVIGPHNFETFAKAIPSENLFIVSVNKNNEAVLENNRSVQLHYPNIYEIDGNDLEESSFIVFYMYKTLYDDFFYKDKLRYPYIYLTSKTDSTTVEEAVNKLLYERTNYDNTLLDYFDNIYNYDDMIYEYNHKDFFSSNESYDYEYKITKLQSIIKNDFSILSYYGRQIISPFESYYLNIKKIDLDGRLRTSTEQESDNNTDNVYKFNEECYVFAFRNDSTENLNLRFFIDGVLCTSYFILCMPETDYIYIPKSLIKSDSYIEVEKFNKYSVSFEETFTHTNDVHTLTFDNNDYISPTLYDLFITDNSYFKLDMSMFDIYVKINDHEQYAVKGHEDSSIIFQDDDTGEYYISVNDILKDIENTQDDEISKLSLKYIPLSKIKVRCIENGLINTPIKFIINKIPYIFHKTMTSAGLPKIKLFNGKVPWKETRSFVRVFVNGRFVPVNYEIEEESPTDTYFVPRCFLDVGEKMTIDISPYSYELEYSLKEIPDNFIISFDGKLSKPFNLAYYDIYLNGRKLSYNNIIRLTNNKIKVFNVHSKLNLAVYRRDRDYEYYGVTEYVPSIVDDLIDKHPNDKDKIIDDIVNHPDNKTPDKVDPNDTNTGQDDDPDDNRGGGDPKDDITPSDRNPSNDTEPDINDIVDNVTEKGYQKYMFYLNVLIPEGVVKPNTFYIDKDLMEQRYPLVYEDYSDKDSRIVMRPNIVHDAITTLMIGKSYEDTNPSEITRLSSFIGDEAQLQYMADGTIIGAIKELYERLGGVSFSINDNGDILVDYETNE